MAVPSLFLSRLPSRDNRDGGAFPPETREGVTPTVTRHPLSPCSSSGTIARRIRRATNRISIAENFRFASRSGPISVSLSAAKCAAQTTIGKNQHSVIAITAFVLLVQHKGWTLASRAPPKRGENYVQNSQRPHRSSWLRSCRITERSVCRGHVYQSTRCGLHTGCNQTVQFGPFQ
jgi:hypothetical protein